MLKYSESPLSQLSYLELFQSRGGGASRGIFGGGQSRDIFRGGPVKKTTLYLIPICFTTEKAYIILLHSTFISIFEQVNM